MSVRIVTRVFAAIAITLLTACVSKFSDQNKDPSKNNQANFRKDLRECQEDYPEVGSGVHIRQWQGCMELKGWR